MYQVGEEVSQVNIDDITAEKELVLVDTKDVNRIIHLSSQGKIPLDKLRVEAMVVKLKSGKDLPPVILDDKNNLVDGHHRLAAHKLVGTKSIPAVYTEPRIHKTFESFILSESTNNTNDEIISYLKTKNFKNPKSDRFYYHGTSISPEKFTLRDDYDFEDSNVWSGELPEGYLFLTTSLGEAKSYGKYIIPCELTHTDSLTFTVDTDNPSRFFDMDYGIDLYKHDKHYGLWDKFLNSLKRVLEIKGNHKSTLITDIENIIPRTDLAIEFYTYQKRTS
jgi:hypothetical protein